MGSIGSNSRNAILFGDDFELDLRAYELRRAGQSLKLERIPMELLRLLLEQNGELVSREQIVERIWGNEVFVDTDNGINAAVRKVRQILQDDPEIPRFIQTVTGKGYRFIAPVQPVNRSLIEVASNEAISQTAVAGHDELSPVGERSGPRFGRRLLVLATIFTLILVVAGGAYFQWFRPPTRSQAAHGRTMLAILPFENLTQDPAQDYFSDGLTEEMIAQVGRIDGQRIGVIARNSAMHYKNSSEPLDQIGHELETQYLLVGSVRRDTGKLRIAAQLVRVNDQAHLWEREYDREVKDLLLVQGEIAAEIANEIPVALGDRNRTKVPPSLPLSPQAYEAHDLYLKGEYFWNNRTVEGFRRAIEYFQQSIAKDPNNAMAYAALADTYALIGGYSMTSQKEPMPKARAAALRAVELDDNLAEAHTAWALVVQNYDWNWEIAEKEFRRAIALNPNNATAHHWYAEHLALLGRFDEALRESERARQLDPLSLIIAADKGVILYYSRRYDAAIEQFRAVRKVDPAFPRSGVIRQVYAQKGMFAEIVVEDERVKRSLGDAFWIWSELAYVYGRTHQEASARHALTKLEDWNRHEPIDPAMFVAPYIGVDNKDEAFAWLEKAYDQHSDAMTRLKVDPLYDPLRSDPRFPPFLRRVGFTQ